MRGLQLYLYLCWPALVDLARLLAVLRVHSGGDPGVRNAEVEAVRDKEGSYLAQVQGDVDLIVLQAAGQWWALPPALCAVNGIAHRMCLVAVGGCADVTVLALGGRSSQMVEKGWDYLSSPLTLPPITSYTLTWDHQSPFTHFLCLLHS